MNSIVVPITESGDLAWAVSQAIEHYRGEPVHVHLLNVRHPLPRHVSQFFKSGGLHDYYRDAGMQVLEPAMRLLDEAGVPHEDHVMVGHKAESIVRFAEEHHCTRVVLDNEPKGLLSAFGLGSIASQVRHLMAANVSNPTSSGASSPT
jgi:nucleotide-binding universal stress UspA family protein